MKKFYQEPDLTVVELNEADIISTSGGGADGWVDGEQPTDIIDD